MKALVVAIDKGSRRPGLLAIAAFGRGFIKRTHHDASRAGSPREAFGCRGVSASCANATNAGNGWTAG
jgi:hypothetical protein